MPSKCLGCNCHEPRCYASQPWIVGAVGVEGSRLPTPRSSQDTVYATSSQTAEGPCATLYHCTEDVPSSPERHCFALALVLDVADWLCIKSVSVLHRQWIEAFLFDECSSQVPWSVLSVWPGGLRVPEYDCFLAWQWFVWKDCSVDSTGARIQSE